MALNFKNEEEIVSIYFITVFATKHLKNCFKMFISNILTWKELYDLCSDIKWDKEMEWFPKQLIYYDVVRTSSARRPPAPTKQMLL